MTTATQRMLNEFKRKGYKPQLPPSDGQLAAEVARRLEGKDTFTVADIRRLLHDGQTD